MVKFLFAYAQSLPILLAQESGQPLIQQLDPKRNVALMMALLGLVLIGITLVACVMIGGHWVRKLARSSPPKKAFEARDNTKLREQLAIHLPEGDPDETTLADPAMDDTKAD